MDGSPPLFVPRAAEDQPVDISKRIRAFYEENPFPGYEKTDTVWSLREKAEKGGQVTFRTAEGKALSVRIPPHAKEGQKLRLSRQGRLCPSCKHEGDLILQIRIEQNR